MKMTGMSLALAAALILGTAGCDLFSPQNKGTIQVNNTMAQTGSLSLWINLDGGQSVTLGFPQLYPFPPVSPGSHTVNFGCSGSCNGNPGSSFQNTGTSSYSDSFQVNGGDLYVLKVSQGVTCYIFNVTGP